MIIAKNLFLIKYGKNHEKVTKKNMKWRKLNELDNMVKDRNNSHQDITLKLQNGVKLKECLSILLV